MKNIFKILNLIIVVIITSLYSCSEEYSIPGSEPNHVMIKTSFGNLDKILLVNTQMSFMDLSRGVVSRNWTFTDDALNVDGSTLLNSDKDYVKAHFTKSGIHNITIKQVFADSVWTDILNYKEYTSTVTVIVLDTVKARFSAVACDYEGVPQQTLLNNENGALNEIKAGRKVQFTSVSLGEPGTFYWKFIRKSDGKTTIVADTAKIFNYKFTSTGDYTVKLIAANIFGKDSIEYSDYIRVVPSTDPITMDGVFRYTTNSIGLSYSRDMKNPGDIISAFTLNVTNGTESVVENDVTTTVPLKVNVNITGISVKDNVVILQLDDKIYNTDNITVSYDKTKGELKPMDSDNITGDSFVDAQLIFASTPNILIDSDYDYNFENTATFWNKLNYGVGFEKGVGARTSAKKLSGLSSFKVSLEAEGGSAFGNLNTQVIDWNTGTAYQKLGFKEDQWYEVGIWINAESVGNKTLGTLPPEIRLYLSDYNQALTEIQPPIVYFDENFPLGVWKYVSVKWKCPSTFARSIVIRCQNTYSSVPAVYYLDDMTVRELEGRP